jgi:hypothetical protein
MPGPGKRLVVSCERLLAFVSEWSLVGHAAQEEASHGDVNHGLGDIEALLEVADETARSDKPAERAFDGSPAGSTLNRPEVLPRCEPRLPGWNKGRHVWRFGNRLPLLSHRQGAPWEWASSRRRPRGARHRSRSGRWFLRTHPCAGRRSCGVDCTRTRSLTIGDTRFWPVTSRLDSGPCEAVEGPAV